MLMSLFSVFDPTSYFGFSLNWLILMFPLVMLPWKYFFLSSGMGGVSLHFNKFMGGMFKEISYPNYLGVVWVSVLLFMYLGISNLFGLFPFIFTGTAHPMITLSLGFVMWVSFFLMGWFKNFIKSAAHLVPEGSPLFLAPVMVLIESISHLIRPFTLSIRLAANMMAGHLIIGLLASVSVLGGVGFSSSLILQWMLLLLELAVAVIQGFVFSILVLLYALEYY